MDTSWVAQYWVEVVFGILCAGMGIFFKCFLKLLKASFDQQKKDFNESIDNKLIEQEEKLKTLIDDRDTKLMELINTKETTLSEEDSQIRHDITEYKNNFEKLQNGVLSIQGRAFKQDCRELLKNDHEISLNEYIAIKQEYKVYKQLGGNGEGHSLYDLVKIKYEKNLK